MEKLFNKSIESKFIKSTLYNTPIPTYRTARAGEYLVPEVPYIVDNKIVKKNATGTVVSVDWPDTSGIFHVAAGRPWTIDGTWGNGQLGVTISLYQTLTTGIEANYGDSILIEEDGVYNLSINGSCTRFGSIYFFEHDSSTSIDTTVYSIDDAMDKPQINITTQIYLHAGKSFSFGAISTSQQTYPENCVCNINVSLNKVAYKIDNIADYHYGEDYVKFTERYLSRTGYYDTETHEKLGQFLRCFRDIRHLDLMPFYNCFSGRYIHNYYVAEKLKKILEDVNVSGNPVSFSNPGDASLKSLEVSVSPKQDGTPWISSNVDTDPYTFRSMPSGASGANREYDKLVGGSVVWNQYINSNGSGTRLDVTATITGHTFTLNGTANANGNSTALFSFETINGHRYFILTSGLTTTRYRIYLSGTSQFMEMIGTDSEIVGDGGTFSFYVYLDNARTYSASDVYKVNVIDITALLSDSTKASNWTFALQHKYFPNFHAYSLPTIQSVSVSEKVTIGVNQLEPNYAVGSINRETGADQSIPAYVRTVGYIPVLPSTEYYLQGVSAYRCYYDGNKNFVGTNAGGFYRETFTTPSNCYYLRLCFNTSSVTDLANTYLYISDPSINGTYYPYTPNTYALSHIDLRGIPSVVDGKLSYDGDEYSSSGAVTRKYGTLTFDGSADESWTFYSGTPARVAIAISDSNVPANEMILCNRFLGIAYDDRDFTKPNTVWISPPSENLLVVVGNFADLAAFKTSLGSNPMSIVYAITPTTETADPYTNPQVIDEHGTESYTDYPMSQGTRDVAIPVGHSSNFALQVPIEGTDEVEVQVSGKNFIPYPYYNGATYTVYGVTFTASSDGSLSLTGTASAIAGYYLNFSSNPILLKAGTYTLSKNQTIPNGSGVQIRIYNTTDSTYKRQDGSVTSSTFQVDEDMYVYIQLRVANGQTVDISNLQIQLEAGNTATDYAQPKAVSTYTHSLSPTMYGGTVEMVSGVETNAMAEYTIQATDTFALALSDSGKDFWRLTTTLSPTAKGEGSMWCDYFNNIDPLADTPQIGDAYLNANRNAIFVTTANAFDATSIKDLLVGLGCKIQYELATQITNQGAGSAVATLDGTNVFSTDGDSVDLTYSMIKDVESETAIVYGDNNYKVVTIPVRFNTDYTIAIDCSSPIYISPIFLKGDYKVEVHTSEGDLDLTALYMKYEGSIITKTSSSFKSPFVIAFENKSSEARILQENERNLYMMIQIPESNTSSIVVLEGNYANHSQETIVNEEDIFRISDDDLDKALLSDLHLLQMNDGTSYAYSPRLIEYLLKNVVTKDETIVKNIKTSQAAMSTYEDTKYVPGIWNKELRVSIAEAYRNYDTAKHLDNNGYVDKDVEKYLNWRISTYGE